MPRLALATRQPPDVRWDGLVHGVARGDHDALASLYDVTWPISWTKIDAVKPAAKRQTRVHVLFAILWTYLTIVYALCLRLQPGAG